MSFNPGDFYPDGAQGSSSSSSSSSPVSPYVRREELDAAIDAAKEYARSLDVGSGTWFATCTTAGNARAKIATTTKGDFKPVAGSRVSVRFSYADITGTATLNVDGTGAFPLYSRTTYPAANLWNASEIVSCVFTGSAYQIERGGTATTGAYGATKLNTSTNSTSTTEAATPSAVNGVRTILSNQIAGRASLSSDNNYETGVENAFSTVPKIVSTGSISSSCDAPVRWGGSGWAPTVYGNVELYNPDGSTEYFDLDECFSQPAARLVRNPNASSVSLGISTLPELYFTDVVDGLVMWADGGSGFSIYPSGYDGASAEYDGYVEFTGTSANGDFYRLGMNLTLSSSFGGQAVVSAQVAGSFNLSFSSLSLSVNGESQDPYSVLGITEYDLTIYGQYSGHPAIATTIATADDLQAGLAGLQAALAGKANATHSHAASSITSGELAAARIPTLDASKIATGTLNEERIPAWALNNRIRKGYDGVITPAYTRYGTVVLGATVFRLISVTPSFADCDTGGGVRLDVYAPQALSGTPESKLVPSTWAPAEGRTITVLSSGSGGDIQSGVYHIRCVKDSSSAGRVIIDFRAATFAEVQTS